LHLFLLRLSPRLTCFVCILELETISRQGRSRRGPGLLVISTQSSSPDRSARFEDTTRIGPLMAAGSLLNSSRLAPLSPPSPPSASIPCAARFPTLAVKCLSRSTPSQWVRSTPMHISRCLRNTGKRLRINHQRKRPRRNDCFHIFLSHFPIELPSRATDTSDVHGTASLCGPRETGTASHRRGNATPPFTDHEERQHFRFSACAPYAARTPRIGILSLSPDHIAFWPGVPAPPQGAWMGRWTRISSSTFRFVRRPHRLLPSSRDSFDLKPISSSLK